MKHLPLTVIAVFGLGLGLVVAAPPLAWAEDDVGLPPTSQFFDEYDTNADGKVVMEEFRGAAEVFKLLDKDGDGAITPEELGLPADYRPDPKRRPPAAGGEAPAQPRGPGAGGRGAKLRERLQAMDVNKDGQITREEWTGPEQMFDRLDRNKDGVLDAKDRPQGAGRGGRPGKGGAGPGQGRPTGPQLAERVKAQVEKQFAKLDADQDGKLTGDEVPNPRLLEVADADQDGCITLAEMQKVAVERAMKRARDARGGDGPRGERRGPRITGGTLKRWDADGDGKVSADEFPGNEELFARLDADKDGFLTPADLKQAGKKPGKKGGTPGQGADGPTDRAPGLIERMDGDGDGRLHRAEFKGDDEAWRRYDRNGDGWITPDEVDR